MALFYGLNPSGGVHRFDDVTEVRAVEEGSVPSP